MGVVYVNRSAVTVNQSSDIASVSRQILTVAVSMVSRPLRTKRISGLPHVSKLHQGQLHYQFAVVAERTEWALSGLPVPA